MIKIDDGVLVLCEGAWRNTLMLNYWIDGAWHGLKLERAGEGYVGQDSVVRARLSISEEKDSLPYALSFKSSIRTRLQLRLSLVEARGVFHLIPTVIFGDNNLAHAEPGHFPNLTLEHPGNISCWPYWEFRADRASHPVSILCFDGGIAGVSIDPYSDCPPDRTNSREGFIRNGVFAQVAHDGEPPACGVTLGYRNTPFTFDSKDKWTDPTEHLTEEAKACGRIFLSKSGSRLDAHRIIRCVYDDNRQTPETPISIHATAQVLTHAFLTVNWQEESENFTNMACTDPEKRKLVPWRTLAEIGWTGGGVIGYPLLVSGYVLGDKIAFERGLYKIDWVSKAFNPASGMLWDVCGRHEGKHLDWWWSGYLVKGVHCAYTNASALYYLLKSFAFCQKILGQNHPEWLRTARRVLDTIVTLQEPSGDFGFTYRADRPEIVDPNGFAGVWFVPALVLANQLTGEEKYLRAAQNGIGYYHSFVKQLDCWGTPMDTWKAHEQEGNLGFIRGAALLHQTLGDEKYLAMLSDGAHYEYIWRYGFRARPEYPPLKGSSWNSCGGSGTSTSNVHVHPMGVFISSELRYLADETGDSYHTARFEDGVNWGINSVSIYPEYARYAPRGVLTERWCPSDGCLMETYPDGSPASMWFSYNGWAAAAVLEGLTERLL